VGVRGEITTHLQPVPRFQIRGAIQPHCDKLSQCAQTTCKLYIDKCGLRSSRGRAVSVLSNSPTYVNSTLSIFSFSAGENLNRENVFCIR